MHTHTTTISDNIVFAYSDSGPPPGKSDHLTVIVFHGVMFHSGAFRSMSNMANPLGYRLIVPNRRLYPGSTPYTEAEIIALQPTSPIEGFVNVLERQGAYLLEFIDSMIKEHGLKKIAITGWSLGSMFLTLVVDAIKHAPNERKKRLRENVRAIISWDPPSMVHGIEAPPMGGWTLPLFDENYTPAQRIQEFLVWVTAYFPHPDNSGRDFSKLLMQMVPNAKRCRTFSNTSPEEFSSFVDVSAAEKGENAMGDKAFWRTTLQITKNVWFNQEIRDAWGNVPFSVIYGDQCPYNCLWAAWKMDEMAKQAGVQFDVKEMAGANHFPMVDDIPLLFETIGSCVKRDLRGSSNMAKL